MPARREGSTHTDSSSTSPSPPSLPPSPVNTSALWSASTVSFLLTPVLVHCTTESPPQTILRLGKCNGMLHTCTCRQRDRQTDRHKSYGLNCNAVAEIQSTQRFGYNAFFRCLVRQTDRQTQTQTETDRQTDRQTDRETISSLVVIISADILSPLLQVWVSCAGQRPSPDTWGRQLH